jgi:hypothetical protein
MGDQNGYRSFKRNSNQTVSEVETTTVADKVKPGDSTSMGGQNTQTQFRGMRFAHVIQNQTVYKLCAQS